MGIRISQLPSAANAGPTDVFPAVQSGATVKLTVAQILALAGVPALVGTRASPIAVTSGGVAAPTAPITLMFVVGSGGPVTTTNIGAAPAGYKLTLMGTAGVSTPQSGSTLTIAPGGNVQMDGSCVLGNASIITYFSDGTNWVEQCRNEI